MEGNESINTLVENYYNSYINNFKPTSAEPEVDTSAPGPVGMHPKTPAVYRAGKYVSNQGTTLGMRNNNPMNLRVTKSDWEGKLDPDTGNNFERFDTLESGIRAGTMNVLRQWSYGNNTVSKLLNVYAPSSDNNHTEAYIKNVSEKLGVDKDQEIDLYDKKVLTTLVKAILRQEVGSKDSALIEDGVIESAFGRIASKYSDNFYE